MTKEIKYEIIFYQWLLGIFMSKVMTTNNKVRILLIDDDEEDFILIRDIVEKIPGNTHLIEWAQNCEKACEKIRSCVYDICLIDYRLKGATGVEVIKQLAENECGMPFIILTGIEDPDIDFAAMQAGASDYLIKGQIDAPQLERAIRYAIKHKKLEQELRMANRKLQQTLEELKNAQEQIVEQERFIALGKMARGIAHDLNNALVPVLGLSDCLLESPDLMENKNELTEILNTIRLAAIDARQILRRLREFYAPATIENRLVDINRIVEQAITLSRSAWYDEARLKGINIKMISDLTGRIELIGNETDLRTVFMNLILNAVEAMDKDGVIEITSKQDDNYGIIVVKDTGCGMSEEVRKQCFIPFFSTKGRKGSGLGLPTCYGIVKRHDGDIKIESSEGKGTTVYVKLPILKGADVKIESEQDKLSSVRDSSASKAINKNAALTVLIVEDNIAGIKVIEKCLKKLGHNAIATTNGHDALKVFNERDVDLVITDRAMPEMSGDELAKKLRAIENKKDVPIFMLTGFGDMMNSTHEKPPFVDCVLSKPITLDELKKAIDSLQLR